MSPCWPRASRRWRCAVELGLETLPAVIREGVGDREMLELALVENVQRADLDPLEKAAAFREMAGRLSLTQEQVAERVGLQRATVANHLRLLELPAGVQDALRKGMLGMGHARALLGLSGAKEQLELLARIVREGLSVRQVERAVQARRAGGTPIEGSKTLVPQVAWVTEIERRILDQLVIDGCSRRCARACECSWRSVPHGGTGLPARAHRAAGSRSTACRQSPGRAACGGSICSRSTS